MPRHLHFTSFCLTKENTLHPCVSYQDMTNRHFYSRVTQSSLIHGDKECFQHSQADDI